VGVVVAKNRSIFIALAIVLLVCLFLLQRGSLLLFGYSHIAHPAFDETASGVLTCDLLEGRLRAPLLAYQYEARSGDGLLEGFLLVPFFKLFGRSLFSLKLCALVSSLFTLICWIVLLKRYHGAWAAIVFAALFALPPPTFARLGLMGTIASHHLINPLAAIQLLVLFRIIEGGGRRAYARWWSGLGLLSALGTYSFYTFIIFSSFCLLFLLFSVPVRVTLRGGLWYLLGFAAGMVPWLFRSLSSPAGGHYLTAILKNIEVDGWSFIQNFFFNLPHSLGYGFPSKETGMAAVLFVIFLACGGFFIIRSVIQNPCADLAKATEGANHAPTSSRLQGLFFLCFPIFFLLCLSLSPMKIYPFEYWPSIGFFGYFSVSDVYRYRWLHLLYPFYFAVAGVGISTLLNEGYTKKKQGVVMILLLIFFLGCGAAGSMRLCSVKDFNRLSCYKGYSYDQMGTRFLLGDMSPSDPAELERFIREYPQENLGEVYRCMGTEAARRTLSREQGIEEFEKWLMGVPSPFRNDAIHGIVRAAQNVSEDEFKVVGEAAAKMYPEAFYTRWGFRHVGYKYYSLLLNREMIFASITPAEKWFFRDFLNTFDQRLGEYRTSEGRDALVRDLAKLPDEFRAEAVRGIGMLVGAEMCFDPLLAPDYPLDSRRGELFEGVSREAFYEGVGMGFTETLRRFGRTLLSPAEASSSLCRKTLEMECDRCRSLQKGDVVSHDNLTRRKTSSVNSMASAEE
jgi:hypothetical protein